MTIVCQSAPDINASAVFPDGSIGAFKLSDYKGKYVVLVFYPLDFTFVCPSELSALDHRVKALKALGVEVASVSIDSQFTHSAWRNTPIEKGGIGPVQYTMIADIDHAIAKAYRVEHPVAGVALRATFVIDKKGVVRHSVVNDLPLGRNMDEIERIVDAIEFFETQGEVCPANWKKGQKGMKPTAAGVASYLASESDKL
jgi:peroxiredoxin (alkyl hydroperoxide reductase subunit C)